MGNTLYLECYSGISGDMVVAALLDLGVDENLLKQTLEKLPVDGFEIQISRVKKSGLDACDFHVVLDEAHENHDHDMDYLYGHAAHVDHDSCDSSGAQTLRREQDGHDGHHEHLGEHEHHKHLGAHEHHEHRGLREILEIIQGADLSKRAEKYAIDIFRVLAEAESDVHGVSKEQVHFHEVGAVDSIVDIVAAAVCLDMLDVSEVIVPYLCEGRGTVRCQHGIIPVPVPAVASIAQKYEIPLRLTQVEGEMVTPTGAAFVAAVRTSDQLPEQMKIVGLGVGAGKREYPGTTGLLRAMLLE